MEKCIHYCWFGNQPLGSDELKCIESWKKFFPNYRVVRWDETNFDVHRCRYSHEAYEEKKWAFVSDYARIAILYRYGGLYFDTDVEVIRSMDDIVQAGPFMGFETDAAPYGIGCTVNPGLGLYATPKLDLYKCLLDSYAKDQFVNPDGTFNQMTIVERTTRILRTFGLEERAGIQTVAGVTIYPSDFFNPKDFFTGEIAVTANTRSIHHFKASWHSKKEELEHKVISMCVKRGISMPVAGRIATVVSICRYGDLKRAHEIIRKTLRIGK